jgi:hypothetical protein
MAVVLAAPLPIVKEILSLGGTAGTKQADGAGKEPLHYAVALKGAKATAYIDVIKLLLKQNTASASHADKEKRLPLDLAVEAKAPLKTILALDEAYPAAANAKSWTRVHLAAMVNAPRNEMEGVLLRDKKEGIGGVALQDTEGKLPLNYAAEADGHVSQLAVCRLLHKHTPKFVTDGYFRDKTQICLASKSGAVHGTFILNFFRLSPSFSII